ncbi:type II toxin-antitoxin system VapB family antitoxin [Mycobacterium avium subsp. hominissuis]|uniref:type II toxin-antitoxin system VapB family antitoxin n=1 Tax=Mycobacterium avium TaxID=1764 RepID=UPI002666C96E|nr:type II toxin-antitoxin system VapB family antitoxin [Mycobacterium avium]MDO2394855.1 type II toxin-antitoxin system VapB family antitoxin [Mycobacterium avium subsp. hominissuis]
MPLTVEDEEVIRLADDLMQRLHLPSRTDAIRYALQAQINLTQSRTEDLLNVMATEVWPLLNDGHPITKQDREQILDYDPGAGA